MKMLIGPIIMFVIWIVIVITLLNGPYDSTYNESIRERSGLELYTDDLTGCQYLKAGIFGGITPRLDGSGNHVGCK